MSIKNLRICNPGPVVSQLEQALVKGVPAFVRLKKDGESLPEIVAAFQGWDRAADADLIAGIVKKLVRTPTIKLARGNQPEDAAQAGHDATHRSDFSLAVYGIQHQLTEIAAKLDVFDAIKDQIALQEDDPSFTVRQVAEKRQMSRTKIYQLTENGELKSYKTGNQVRIRASHVREYQERHTRVAKEAKKRKPRSFNRSEANRFFGEGWET